jgi:hypothetical protein
MVMGSLPHQSEVAGGIMTLMRVIPASKCDIRIMNVSPFTEISVPPTGGAAPSDFV